MGRIESFTRDGLVFDLRDAGPENGTPVVLLHGFPQDSRCWDRVAPLLHEHGYRTLAPDQRGYSSRARPAGLAAYRGRELVADVGALVEAADAGPVHLVGHDWGAVVAWATAARHPELLRSLSTLSVPHPAAFARAMRTTPQAFKSWYVLAFQLPRLPELALASPWFEAALRRTGSPSAARDATLMRERDTATAALAWYRAMRSAGGSSGGGSSGGGARITVPTLHVWSDGDSAVGPWGARENPRYVDAPYRFEVLCGVSHWIPEEAPERLADLLLAHFASVG
ncbi:MAG TPA: alpha/beta fold hydrolase [Nocardioidaceae bacterium]|nr:alpha/beta fold hydrolase [Nocardioidaceae bacterium]